MRDKTRSYPCTNLHSAPSGRPPQRTTVKHLRGLLPLPLGRAKASSPGLYIYYKTQERQHQLASSFISMICVRACTNLYINTQETITASETVANNKPILESFRGHSGTCTTSLPQLCHRSFSGWQNDVWKVFWQIKHATAHHTPAI
jgi:hypothetical protein